MYFKYEVTFVTDEFEEKTDRGFVYGPKYKYALERILADYGENNIASITITEFLIEEETVSWKDIKDELGL